MDTVDYGPLSFLVGTWEGKSGIDIAPDPEGSEENSYYETLIFEAVGDVDNAESQEISIVHYEQVVRKNINDEVIHRQTGFWTWDAQTKTVCNGFTIPRRVAVLAGGTVQQSDAEANFSVAANKGDPDWGIIEAGFMRENASTSSFIQTMNVSANKLVYSQTTSVDIYGKSSFEHTDQNELTRIS